MFAYNAQASLRMLNRDNADGVSWGRRALGVAERLGDRKGTALAPNYIGTSHVMAGDYEPGVEHLLRTLELARASRTASASTRRLGCSARPRGDERLDDAESYLEQQVAFAEERDLSPAYSASWLACLYVYRGRWDERSPRSPCPAIRTESVISQITGWIALGRVPRPARGPGCLRRAR